MWHPLGKQVGRSLPITPYRTLVCDLMHFSQQVPSVAIERRMDLREVVAARSECTVRPSWTLLFSKAFALLGRDHPILRRSYLKLPWPRIYEYPHHAVALNVERRLADEDIVVFCLIERPENRSLVEMEAIVRHHREAPIGELRSYQRAVGVSRIPWPFRRWFWYLSLNLIGRRRCHNFGTFSVSSVASQGAGILHVVPLLTTSLHYGLFDERGRLDLRLSFDHRVMDGATMSRAMVDMEAILKREIVRELREMRRLAA